MNLKIKRYLKKPSPFIWLDDEAFFKRLSRGFDLVIF